MYNPRFPHILSVSRTRMRDGEPVIDNNGNVVYDPVTLTCVEMFDNEPTFDANGQFITYESASINFGYRTASRNSQTMGDVTVAALMLACPMFLTEIRTDDIVTITDYVRTFKARVIKQSTTNLGTNLWVDEIKN